jgi:hypothetical protein
MSAKSAHRLLQLLVLAVTLGLAACGTATPYQPLTDGYGYAEQPLEADRYRVVFTGNSLTPRETVENYLLYRAAEVTLARGYDYFVVVEKDTERETTYFSTVTGVASDGFRRDYDVGVGAYATSTSRPSSQYSAYANVILRKGRKGPGDTGAYDAREVLNRLAPTILRKPAS